MTKPYRVIWEIDVEADSAEEAARKAQAIQRDPTSIATVFTVKEDNVEPGVDIDLAEKST